MKQEGCGSDAAPRAPASPGPHAHEDASAGFILLLRDELAATRAELAHTVAALEVQNREALRLSEARYRLVTEANPIGIIHGTASGQVKYCNDAFCRITGYSREDFLSGRVGWADITPPEWLPVDWEHVAEARQRGACTPYEKEYTRKDGGRAPVLVGFSMSGSDEDTVAFILDLAAQKQAEAALRKQNDRLALLSQAAAQLLSDDDPVVAVRRLFELVSPALGLCGYLNFLADEATASLQLASCAGVSEDLREALLRVPFEQVVCGAVALTRQPRHVPSVQESTNPVLRHLRLIGIRAAVCNPLIAGDQLLGVLSFFATDRDRISDEDQAFLATISRYVALAWERARLARIATTEAERVRLAVTGAGVGYWSWDLAAPRCQLDPRSAALFECTEPAPLVTDLTDKILPEDRPARLAALQAAREGHKPYRVDYRIQLADGRVRWLSTMGDIMRDDTGRPVRLVGIVLDASERKQAEAALRESDRRKDEFLATLAHELRNPLAPLRNGLQVLRLAPNDPARQARARDMMERQLAHMIRLVDDLLDVARINQGKLELRRERVGARTIIEGALETSRPLIEARRHRLSVRLPEGPVFLRADPTRLAQVVSNLLNNAAKYTPTGGHIELSARLERGGLVIDVSDNGDGIPADMLDRVFGLFTQVGTALSRSQGGLGIGLSLVHKLVELHGGTVRATSEGPGRGSTFTVRLPLCEDPAGATPAAAGEAAAPAPTGRRVLIVDDNHEAAESLAMLLELQGNETRTAHSGAAALALIPGFHPEFVLLDIGMPGLSGYDVARALRQDGDLAPVVLVALTGWGSEGDKQQARDAGFDHHLTKPVDPATVMRLLAA